ncbi:MAG TPA: hypothetical protein VJS92_14325 [Candidatus Polarisedimenticolaceae bacterium]|nr:hypothetical protein [Candidatus Polarisedimenticolaceae bacterium]
MIRPLRRWHLVAWIVLAAALLAGLAASFAVRSDPPAVERIPR